MTELSDTDLKHLRRAIAIAAEAREEGEEPYGSLLVDAAGRVLAEEHNTVLSTADVTAHPELKLGRLAGRLPEEVARGCTLYTSCEPCAMCGEVLARGRLGRVVFALSERQSRELEGPPNRQAPASIGPALYDEGIAAIGDFYSRPAEPERINGRVRP
jgi:tRNA(Arg) A34 adenosine deaminase TadA